MNAPALPKHRMNVDEYLAWGEGRQGRYELVDGVVVAMAPERIRDNLVKAAACRALDDAVRAAKLPCTVFTDGVAVVINDHTSREPDASVQCGIAIDLDAMTILPTIVVEVVSPSSERNDTDIKLVEYFSVPSIRHYLIVVPEKHVVVHHQRNQRGTLDTRIAHDGDIVLNPPGLTVAISALLGRSLTPEDITRMPTGRNDERHS